MNEDFTKPVDARASIAGYIALSGIFWGLGLGILLVFPRSEPQTWQGVAAMWSIATLFVVWLRGFRIRIREHIFEYRDGLYRTRRCRLEDIKSAKVGWISRKLLGRALKVPRMVLEMKDGNSQPIVVNIKPFSRTDLAAVRSLLTPS